MTATVIRNGSVFDGHRYLGRADVLVVDGRIATGDVPPGATEVDAAGGLVSPGFTDSHVHAVQGGLERIRCDLSHLSGRDAYLAAVAAYAKTTDAEWILGGGWAIAAFPGGTPTAAELDAVVLDRPVFLPNRDHHGAWVNSRALQIAGVTRETPDPPDGRLERDSDGNPTGTLHEGAMALVRRCVTETGEDELYRGLLAGQSYLHSVGVTGWQDAIVGDYAGMEDAGPVYRLAAERRELTSYVVGALWWDRDRGEEQIDDLLARRRLLTHGRFRATSVKFMQDGVVDNGSAALTEPYLDRCGLPTDDAGHSFVSPDILRKAVARLDAEGFQIHVHGLGDRGVHEALDAFDGTSPSNRHHIAHLQLIEDSDVPRFAALGVSANIQALWACLDDQMVDHTLPFLGEERARRQYRFGDLHRAGARIVCGSDWPVSTPNPLEAMHVAVNRKAYGESGRAGAEAFLPEQALDLPTVFAAYTSGSAWVNHRNDAGVLAPGAIADLVVLDRDPFGIDPGEIGSVRVASTWIDGEPVYGT